jgi:TRAP-type C4-dicarboxylate transport system permease small subunit
MAFFVVVLAAIGVRAVPRWQFHASIELSRLFFVWSCFLAAGLAYRREAHVGFTLLFDKMPVVVQRGLTSVVYSLVLGFVAVVLFQSVLTCFLLWPTVLPILGISQAWLYVPVPVLCLSMLFYTLEFIADAWRPAARGSA